MEITNEQIEKLRDEMATHGDLLMVAICNRALDLPVGDDVAVSDAERRTAAGYTPERARRECAKVIAAADAMRDE